MNRRRNTHGKVAGLGRIGGVPHFPVLIWWVGVARFRPRILVKSNPEVVGLGSRPNRLSMPFAPILRLCLGCPRVWFPYGKLVSRVGNIKSSKLAMTSSELIGGDNERVSARIYKSFSRLCSTLIRFGPAVQHARTRTTGSSWERPTVRR